LGNRRLTSQKTFPFTCFGLTFYLFFFVAGWLRSQSIPFLPASTFVTPFSSLARLRAIPSYKAFSRLPKNPPFWLLKFGSFYTLSLTFFSFIFFLPDYLILFDRLHVTRVFRVIGRKISDFCFRLSSLFEFSSRCVISTRPPYALLRFLVGTLDWHEHTFF